MEFLVKKLIYKKFFLKLNAFNACFNKDLHNFSILSHFFGVAQCLHKEVNCDIESWSWLKIKIYVISIDFLCIDQTVIRSSQCCLSLEVMSSIPTGSTIIYQFLCGFTCVSRCQSIKIKPTNIYIISARAQFKINTNGCWNWHLCIQDELSIVQCSLRHVIGIVFIHNFSGMKRTCHWQLAVLTQSGGCEFDPHQVHDNLLVPFLVYMRFPAPEYQN